MADLLPFIKASWREFYYDPYGSMSTLFSRAAAFWKEHWFALVLVFAGYLIVAQISSYLYREVGHSSSVILSPAGVAFAAVILEGYVVLPAIALAALVNGILAGTPLLIILGSVIGNTGQAYVAYLVLRSVKFSRSLVSVKDMFALVTVALFGSIVVPTVNYWTSILYNVLYDADRVVPFISLWMGGAVSMMVITPFLVRWIKRGMTPRTQAQLIEVAALILAVCVTSFFLFATPYTSVYGVSLILVLIGLLMIMAFRCGPRFMTLVLFLMTVISFLGAMYGTYEPTEGGIAERIFNTQVFDLFIAFFFFILVSLEEQRKDAVRHLTQQNRQLQGAVQDISSEADAKNEFIATLAHELRNPLAPLLSSVETMLLDAPPHSAQAGSLNTMHHQIKTMGYLLDDLLDIARVSQKKLRLQMQMHDIESVVRRAVTVTTPHIAQHHHALTVTLPDEHLELEIDGMRIEQIIVNLLHNASKYTPDGGKIELVVECDHDELVIEVQDNGIGIPADMMNRVFEPFVQVRHPSGMTGGIGIGLALTKNIVELHDGTIGVTPAPGGKGTVFTVRIPVRRSENVVKRPRLIEKTVGNKGLNLLVVDDNKPAADSLARLLSARGHRVHAVYSGTDAIVWLSSNTPDAVILDIGLSDIDGFEIARRIKQTGMHPVIIGVTGYGQEEDRRKSAEAGFDFHLTKPVGLDVMEPILAQVGSRSARQSQARFNAASESLS